MGIEHNIMEIFRFCPKCGNQEFIRDSVKSLKCNHCGFRYFINMSTAVAGIIRNNSNEVLFTIRKHSPAAGMLDLPGGFVDLGETAETALIREIHEELNLNICEMVYHGTYTNKYLFEGVEYQTLDIVFNCRVDSFKNLTVDDDVSGFVFKRPEEVSPDEIGLSSIQQIIEDILSQ